MIRKPVTQPAPSTMQQALLEHADGARLAALNLMEDAVSARDAAEHLSDVLQASEARFRQIIKALPAAVFVTDAQDRLTHSNSAAAQLIGRTPEVGTLDWCDRELYHADGKPIARGAWPVVLLPGSEAGAAQDASPGAEARFIRADGTWVWIEAHSTALRDARGELAASIRMFVDITERKQAEIRIQESENRYRTLSSVLADLPWSSDSQGKFVEVQSVWARYTGQGREEYRGFGWLDAIHKDDRQRFADKWQRAVANGTECESRGRLWHAASHGFRHFTMRAAPVRDGEGSIREWVGAFTDVHERWLDARALRRSEERFRDLADNISQLAWIANERGDVEWVNKRWTDFAGVGHEALIGDGWKEFLHPEFREQIVEVREQALGAGKPWEATFPLRGAHGDYRWFMSRCEPIRDERGVAIRWFDTSTDVTERREMERHIQIQAEQLAEEARRKDEFLAMLSHELRNPLAAVRSAARLLQDDRTQAPMRPQALEIIDRQVANLTVLVNDLLDVSRMTSNRIHLVKRTCDMNEVLRQAVEAARPAVEARGHQLTLQLCDAPLWVDVDRSRIDEIFMNLLDNAAKFTEAGGRIGIHCERDDVESAVRVRIRDTGCGVDPETLPVMFELFTQADNSLARATGGLGIGLAVARNLAVLHGGTLDGHSPPQGADHGSEFIVTLPQARAPAPEEAGKGAGSASATVGRKVLVVDDNRDQMTMLSSVLEGEGLQVRSACTGEGALSEVKQWHPDIALLDIGLPDLDGYEVARAVRADPDLGGVRLIAISGYASKSDIAKSRAAGFDAHLAKPLDHSKLMALISAA